MIIIGCDYHPGFQQIAFVDTETGDYGERRLEHSEGAEKFYRDLAAQGKKVRVGMEASGHARWFERLLAELTFELWIGDASEIRAKRVRKQKTILHQQLQNMLRILPIRFLLAYPLGANLAGIANPQFEGQLRQQTFKPAGMPTGFHSHSHLLALVSEVTIKPFCSLTVL